MDDVSPQRSARGLAIESTENKHSRGAAAINAQVLISIACGEAYCHLFQAFGDCGKSSHPETLIGQTNVISTILSDL
jgi:hypothetical protein